MAWRKKNKKDAPIVALSQEEIEKIEEEVGDLVSSQLPLGRVKRLVSLNPDVEMVNKEALQMMTKAAELFIKELSRSANEVATQEKRKTLQPRDIDSVIKKTWQFAFLEDALDGWPKLHPKKRTKVGVESQETHEAEDTENQENPEVIDNDVIEEEEEEDDELPETVPEENDEEGEEEERRDVFAEQF